MNTSAAGVSCGREAVGRLSGSLEGLPSRVRFLSV